MATSLVNDGRRLATKILVFQTAVMLVVTLLALLLVGSKQAVSALFGGLVCIVPGMLFARFAFKYAGATKNKLIVQSFSQGLKLKFALSILLFIAAYKWAHVEALPLLVSYAITQLAQLPYTVFLSRASLSKAR